MHIEILKQLNKKYGGSKFFQHIVRENLKVAECKKDKVIQALSVINK